MTRLITVFIVSAALASAGPFGLFKGKKGHKTEKAATQGFDTTYTGGTVAVVPKYIGGKLDLSDKTNLQFHYGKPSLTVPYARITGIEVADTQKDNLLSIPGMNKKKRLVTIGWEDENGVKNNARFELGIGASIEALPLLEQRSGRAVTIAGMRDAEGWWGDTAWKTPRNAHTWEPPKPEKPAIAAAKE